MRAGDAGMNEGIRLVTLFGLTGVVVWVVLTIADDGPRGATHGHDD
jgi:hypothetical protein